MTVFDTNIQDEVLKATRVLASPQVKEPKDAIAALTDLGFSRARAEKLFFVTQLAFGRVVIERLGIAEFPTTFLLNSFDGIKTEHSLFSEPSYNAALGLARATFANGPRETFSTICWWSAELRAANDALNKGEKVGKSKLLTPTWYSTLGSKELEEFS